MNKIIIAQLWTVYLTVQWYPYTNRIKTYSTRNLCYMSEDTTCCGLSQGPYQYDQFGPVAVAKRWKQKIHANKARNVRHLFHFFPDIALMDGMGCSAVCGTVETC